MDTIIYIVGLLGSFVLDMLSSCMSIGLRVSPSSFDNCVHPIGFGGRKECKIFRNAFTGSH